MVYIDILRVNFPAIVSWCFLVWFDFLQLYMDTFWRESDCKIGYFQVLFCVLSIGKDFGDFNRCL